MAKSATPTPARRAPTRAAQITNNPNVTDVVQDTGGAKIALSETATPDDEKVTAIVPTGFTLTRDNHTPVVFTPGVGEYFRSDVEHWYSQAMGVKEYVKGEE